MGCYWRNLAVTYVLHYIWWGVGKDLSFSMDWHGCFMYKAHSETLFSITLYGTVCPLYRLLPLPHAWGKSDHNLHYKPHHETLYHHITLQYHKWSQQNCETNEPKINSKSMPKFVGFHPCSPFCCWMWYQVVFTIYWSHQQARKIYMTTAIVEYNINSLNHTMLHEIYSSDNKYLCVCAT